MKKYFIFIILIYSQVVSAATYYVRTDGGTSAQCTGTADAAYPGSGTGQACAFSHPAWALGAQGSNGVMSAGDTLIISAEQYMIGYGMPNDSGSTSWTYDSVLDTVPAGASSSAKTKIYGAGYNTGCTGTKAQLWGTERARQVLSINSNTDLQCIEITDHSACIQSGPIDGNEGDYPVQCAGSYPWGTWATVGLNIVEGATDISISNVDIHGLAYRGIFAYRVGNIGLTNVKIIGNGFVGWDSDGTGDDSYTGTITLTNSKIEWNGCGEKYPLTTSDLSASTDKHHCWSQSQGGYGDGIGLGDGTTGNWYFYNSSVSWNTSDGVDLLHGNGTGTVKFIRSRAEGNAGQAFKSSVGTTYIENSLLIGNCGFFSGQSFTSTKSNNGSDVGFDNCRAAGDTVAFSNSTGGQKMHISNSTILSNGNVVLLSGGSNCDAETVFSIYNSIVYGGTEFNDGSDLSAFYYASGSDGNGAGACGSLAITENYNLHFNTKNSNDGCVGANDVCDQNPSFAGTIRQGPAASGYYTTPDYWQQLTLSPTSLARNAANINITLDGTSNDFLARARGAVWDMGAYEFEIANWFTFGAGGPHSFIPATGGPHTFTLN